MTEINAMVAHEDAEGGIVLRHEVVDESFLPDGDVEIRVEYSSVNYKDALAVTPKGGVARSYPLIPGIDVAGTVTASTSVGVRRRRRVIAHGQDIGTGRHGGYAQVARYPAEFLVKLTSAEHCGGRGNRYGRLHRGDERQRLARAWHHPADGPVLVTGATGGVGSVSVDLLSGLGYEVVASTGKSRGPRSAARPRCRRGHRAGSRARRQGAATGQGALGGCHRLRRRQDAGLRAEHHEIRWGGSYFGAGRLVRNCRRPFYRSSCAA